MSQHSPEQAFPAERQEDEDIASLEFDSLQIGDQVQLYFVDGRCYWLTIDSQDEEGSLFANVQTGRKLQLAAEIQEWKPYPHILKMKGSCERLRVENGEVSVVGELPGRLIAGMSAWFGLTTDRGEKNQASPQIQTIKASIGQRLGE